MAVETLHAVTYFAPTCRQALRRTGLERFWTGYFAARAAPLGRAAAGTVAAAFYNFHPEMVASAIPGAWEVVDPDEVTVVRAAAAASALFEICSPGALAQAVSVLPLLREASLHCSGDGRVLAGANRGLWATIAPGVAQELRGRSDGPPVELAEVWQSCTTLRDHRGDGHVAALVAQRIDGLEAHVLAAAVTGTPIQVLRDNRGWSEDQWDLALARLVGRGLLRSDGTATGDGRTLHASVEAMTDARAEEAYGTLSDGALDELYDALDAGAREIRGAGTLPFPNPMGLPPG